MRGAVRDLGYVYLLLGALAGCGAPELPGEPGAETPADEPIHHAEGTLELVMVRSGEASLPEYHLERSDGTWVRLSFDRRHDLLHSGDDHEHSHLGLPAQSRIRVRGLLRDGHLEVLDLALSRPAADEVAQHALLAPSPKKVAVILANFSNNQSQPVTADAARALVFTAATSSNAYFKEVSFGARSLVGKLRPDGDVFGWYTIAMPSTSCDYGGWGNAARAAAQAAGVDLSGYDHVIHYFPREGSCGWSGVGQMPGRYTWINGSGSSTIAHELGHNFSLHHASALSCRDAAGARVAVSASCSSSEYGDPFDVMGRGYRHLNAYHKGRLGWLEPANLATATADGTFQVTPLARPSTGIQSLRVPIGTTGQFYYVELRQPFGFDNFAAGAHVTTGVLIHRAPDYGKRERPQLLDMTAGTTSFNDAALIAGQTFSDGSVRIRVDAVSATAATVTVDVP